jgi:DNA-binding response OmpR family regulator
LRLLIVEDHDELAALVRARLGGIGLASDRFSSIDLARAAIQAGEYAALILDLGLPDGDGINLLKWLRGVGNPMPVLVLTARSRISDRVVGLEAGADDYLVKPFATEELIARVQALLRRGIGHDMAWECGRLVWDTRTRSGHVEDRALLLSARETQLLDLLLRDRGKVVRKRAIEASFFGLGDEFSSNAVEVSVHRLRRRLNAVCAGVEIVTVRGLGYLLQAADA